MSSPEEIAAGFNRGAAMLRNTGPLMAKIGNVALAAGMKRTPVDKGTLRRSEGMRGDPTSATLYATADHAGWVHDGTEKMPARPYFTEGIQDALGEIEGHLNDFGEEVLGAVSG